MSFSSDVKQEITKQKITNKCCVLSVCYAIVCFGRYYDEQGLILHTENEVVAQFAQTMFEKINVNGEIILKGTEKKPVYEFAVKEKTQVDTLLQLFPYTQKSPILNISTDVLECEECIHSFIFSAFLYIGTVVNPQNDYNLEFISNKQEKLIDLQNLLNQVGFTFKHVIRKSTHVLYLKNSGQIEDLLTIMGASNASFDVMNFKIYKDFRNKANRRVNCETANISKIINANQATIRAIEYLKQQDALIVLPEQLQYLAKLRIENQESSLLDLSEMITPSISKSGVAHRLKKIEKIAADLKEKKEKNYVG